jgi:hypothetical protein
MARGPIELVVIGFAGDKFSSRIMPALEALVNSKTVRILDLAFVKKDQDGGVRSLEFNELTPDEVAMFECIGGEVYGVIGHEDILAAAAALPNNSSAALIIWEATWAVHFRTEVRKAHGMLIAHAPLKADVVEKALNL